MAWNKYRHDGTKIFGDGHYETTIEMKAKLSEKYKITNLGKAPQFLAIEIHHEKGTESASAGRPLSTTFLKDSIWPRIGGRKMTKREVSELDQSNGIMVVDGSTIIVDLWLVSKEMEEADLRSI